MGEVLEARRLLSRPTIVSAAFDYETSPHKYVVTFDQNVAASLSAADLRVEAVTSTDQNPVASSLSYDGGTNTATFTFAGVLPEANYRAVLSSEDVANGAGEPLASDHVDDFFFLVADASGPDGVPDRLVGVADQDRISANFGGSNKTFSQGDYNYDTIVNMADFNLLANKFGAEMPPPPDGPGVTMVRAVTSSSLEPNWIDNVTGEAGWRVQWSFDGQNFSNYVNLDADSTFWPHTGLPDNTRVWYRTRAHGNGQDTAYTPKVAANTLLAAPGKASVTELDDGRYEITFPDNSVNESGFVVEVTDPGGGPTQTYTVPPNGDGEASIVLDTNELPDVYEVLVRATGLQDSATTKSDTYARAIPPPRNLELRATGPNTVSIRWRDRSINETGFRIERFFPPAGGQPAGFKQVGQVSFNNERWTNYGVLAGKTHDFRVRAYGALGFSPYSEPKFVTTPSQHMPGEPDFPSEPPAPQGQVGPWQTHGGDVSIDQTLNRISLGATNLSETDRPYSHLRSASYPLGQNPPSTITFDYDLSTFDAAQWDTFGVSVTDVPYHQITQGSTLPTLAFAWGGATDRGLETKSGTATVDVPPNSAGMWLNFTLGANQFTTGFFPSGQPNTGMRDNWYPSWGTFTIRPADLAVDSNNDGAVNAADAAVEDEGSGVIIPVNDDDDDHDGTPDMDQTGTVTGEDDLAELKLSLFPPDASGTVSLSVPSGADKVRLYETADRSTPLTQTIWPAGQQPKSVWAEAIKASASVGATSFSLGFEPSGAGQPTTDPARTTPTQFKIAPEYVNQDNPTATTFAPLEPLSDGKTVIYGGSEASTSDDLKLRVETTPASLAVARYTWTVSRAEAVENAPPAPGANNLYQVGNIWAKPGDLTFNATVRIGAGDFVVSRKLEVGVRTDDVIIASWIDPAGVPALAPAGVAGDYLSAFPMTPAGDALPPPNNTWLTAAGGILIALQAGDDSPPRPNDLNGSVPLNAAERTYLMHWMFKRAANDDPALAIPGNDFRNSSDTGVDENEVANFLGNPFNYKLFNRLQIKYRKGTSGFNGTPVVLHHSVAVGDTINPLGSNVFPYYFNGQTGPAMTSSAPFSNMLRVSSIVDGSPDDKAIKSFNTLTAVGVANPVWWENIGNRMSFRFDGNLATGSLTLPDLIFQPYPKHNVYINGRHSLALSGPQAGTPTANFNTNPYPFGPGGRDGNAEDPAAPGARQPPYTIP